MQSFENKPSFRMLSACGSGILRAILAICDKVLYLRHNDPWNGSHTEAVGNGISLNEVFGQKFTAQIPHLKTNVQIKCN